MPANRRMRYRTVTVITALVLAVCAGAGITGPFAARAVADPVKYYKVGASYAGKPENLSEIALRLLGSSARSADIFALNVGRKQPDGGALTDPNSLRPGWYLELPWDAVGAGVSYGELPTSPPAPQATKAAPRASQPAPPATAPVGTPGPATNSTGGPVRGCEVAAASGESSNWATLRMAPQQGWTRTRGKGVVVAVVDSGVDASLPELTGLVAVGADIVSGSGRGDTDCLGSGTAMAAIIVGQPSQTSSLSGIAPESTVLPIRVVTTSSKALVADQASGVEVAVSAGASVLALGSYVDITEPKVAQAIADAVKHNVVVVACAPTVTSAATDQATQGLLRVGGVGVDDTSAADYRSGEVDVVAPGVDITALGINGIGVQNRSGTDLAVAFVAGEAALARAAHPNLTASQVAHRVEVTADKQGGAAPDSRYGWGLINPSAAVVRVLAEEQPGVRSPVSAPVAGGGGGGSSSSSGSTVAIVVIASLGLLVAAAFAFRLRHIVRARSDGGGDGDDAGAEPAGGVSGGQPYAGWQDAGWSEESHRGNGMADPSGAATARPVPSRPG